MKRGTKRAVGWGAGVAIGVVFVVLTFVLIAGITSSNNEAAPQGDVSFQMDMVETSPQHDSIGH